MKIRISYSAYELQYIKGVNNAKLKESFWKLAMFASHTQTLLRFNKHFAFAVTTNMLFTYEILFISSLSSHGKAQSWQEEEECDSPTVSDIVRNEELNFP